MRHLFHYQGLQFHCDSEIPFTHVVIGQRDEAAAKAALPPGNTVNDFTPEQLVKVKKFVFDSTHGWYAMKPLAWAESLQQAEEFKTKFESEGWVNVSIQQILEGHVLKYA